MLINIAMNMLKRQVEYSVVTTTKASILSRVTFVVTLVYLILVTIHWVLKVLNAVGSNTLYL